MALRFIDSFDHYVTADILSKWTQTASSPQIASGSARFGAGGLSCNTSTTTYVAKVLDAKTTWIVGVAVKFPSVTPANDVPFLQLVDGTTLHVDVRLTTAGFLRVTRNGTTLATGSTALSTNVWYYVELKCTIDDTTGSFELRLNTATEVSGTNVDTRNAGNASADRIRIGGGSASGPTLSFDDAYICDSTGGANNDFLGDCRVECLFPSGNGNSSQLDGSDGNQTDNYLLVDEAAPNGDTDFVESPDAGDKDTYAFTDLTSTSGTVFGVQPIPYAKKTDAGARSIATVARLSGTETDGPTTALSTSYQYLPDIRETKPGGGTWTISDVNSAEFGTKVV